MTMQNKAQPMGLPAFESVIRGSEDLDHLIRTRIALPAELITYLVFVATWSNVIYKAVKKKFEKFGW